jgi:multicomponent Na+:H+ antiporter subunit C
VSQFEIYAVTGVLVFLIGLFRLVTGTQLLRLVLALHVMGSGAFLVLIATAYRDRAPDPDPVPHAMVLTGIVVTTSVTAFAVTLIRRMHARTGHEYLADVEEEGEVTPGDRAAERDG